MPAILGGDMVHGVYLGNEIGVRVKDVKDRIGGGSKFLGFY